MHQVFERRDNKIQHDDLVKTINNVVLTFIISGANIVISIESNMTGTAIISDLIALNHIYKTLIYRNTIGPDISKPSYEQPLEYSKCDYGVSMTGGVNGTRELLINYIFKHIDTNLAAIRSKEMMQEIESLEIDKNGKVEGHPHDDTIFALGHCLLIKYRARRQNLYSIFRYCNDIRLDKTTNEHMKLSLQNYDNEAIEEVLNMSGSNSNTIAYGATGGLNDLAYLVNSQQSNFMQNDISIQLSNMPFANIMQPIVNPTVPISTEMFSMIREQILQQSQAIANQVKQQKERDSLLCKKKSNSNNIVDDLVQKITKKSKRKALKEETQIASNTADYVSQTKDEDTWFGAIIG